MIGHGPAATPALADVDRGRAGARHAMGQDGGAAEPRAHDAPVAKGWRHAVDQDAAAALAEDLNLKVEGRGLAECLERQQPVCAARFHGPCSLSKRGWNPRPRRESYCRPGWARESNLVAQQC